MNSSFSKHVLRIAIVIASFKSSLVADRKHEVDDDQLLLTTLQNCLQSKRPEGTEPCTNKDLTISALKQRTTKLMHLFNY